jgi:hypothetical protein
MNPTHFIPDGYEEQGYIAERPRMFPALRFVYRPMIAEDRDVIITQSGRKPPAEYHKVLRAAMVSRMKEWNATDDKGQPLPISSTTLRNLRPRLFDRLYSIVSGDEPSDIDPASTPTQQNEAADAALEAAISGKPAPQAKQEADAKNS